MLLPRYQLGCLALGQRLSRVHRCAAVERSTVRSPARQLLDSFWEARGVLDPVQRKRLVDAAEALDAEALRQQPLSSAPLSSASPLPGLPASWQLEEYTPEVLAASSRLLALQQMLGGGLGAGAPDPGALGRGGGGGGGRAIDVVWMVVREPGLLSADLAQITGRMMEMKLATYGTDVDVLKVIEAQPALLLSDRWRLDLESLQVDAESTSWDFAAADQPLPYAAAPTSTPTSTSESSSSETGPGVRYDGSAGRVAAPQADGPASSSGQSGSSGGGSSGAGDSTVRQLVQAWQYGIASDGDQEWAARLAQLSAYAARHGDTCVGFRDGDDPELGRWAAKQRADRRRGELTAERLDRLSALGFHFDGDEAEWCRWYSELRAFKAATGHASPMPLVTGGDMYLINWCSVQRIARRSRVLSESRMQRLDEVGFDWSGADPLS